MKTLFLNPYSGIAGDMFVAALLDLGVDQEAFDQAMRSLPLPAEEWSYDVESVVKSGVKSTKFNVHFQEKASHHHGRHLSEIIRIIEASALSERAQTNAKAIFQLLAEAEAEVHGTTVEKVHFHEVGAVDAIADICGAAICMDLLDIEGLVSSPPALGSGTVNCDHGTMPVPVPAVSNLLREVPVKACSIPFELTTPTGAAILKHFAKAFEASPEGKIIESGYGAGNRELESQANVLPVLLLEAGNEATERVTVIECNLDDMPGEYLSYLGPKLLSEGALDYAIFPCTMKKNRQGMMLQLICQPQDRERLGEIILRESSSFGIRYYDCQRQILKRESKEVETPYGTVTVKIGYHPDSGEQLKVAPEYESCRERAEASGKSLQDIYDAARKACN